jgi:hypothetical protein
MMCAASLFFSIHTTNAAFMHRKRLVIRQYSPRDFIFPFAEKAQRI